MLAQLVKCSRPVAMAGWSRAAPSTARLLHASAARGQQMADHHPTPPHVLKAAQEAASSSEPMADKAETPGPAGSSPTMVADSVKEGRTNTETKADTKAKGKQQQQQQQHAEGEHAEKYPRRPSHRRGSRHRGERSLEDEFDLFRNQINHLMGSLMGPSFGRSFGFPSFPSMSSFGLPSLPGGRGQQQMLGEGGAEEESNLPALSGMSSPLDFFRGGGSDLLAPSALRMDIEDKDNSYEVTCEVPGMKPEELKVHVDGNLLTIEGKHAEEKQQGDKEKKFLRMERVTQSVKRSVRLPSDAEHTAGAVKAKYQDGLLKIEIPKVAEEQRHGNVQIERGEGAHQPKLST